MNLSEQQISKMLAKGEGLNLEFKTCRNQLSRSLYETVCAFLNRHGGTLLLGVQDDGAVQGIDPNIGEQLRKNFVTTINDPKKINPPTYLTVDEVQFKGKTLLRIHVPESSQVHRCNGRFYDRNEDADMDVTDHTDEVALLYQRKQGTYSENKVLSHIRHEDLRSDLIERCRHIAHVNTRGHPWADMNDFELLQSAQLYQTDPITRKQGVTLAGVMLLAPDSLILQACPAHRTDLILRKVNVERYDDRDLVRTNLIDSYDRVLAFVRKHLSDPFYLEGIERISLRDVIFREVASNILIHREYASRAGSRMIITNGEVTTENPNRPHGFGILDPQTATPHPKNPVIGAFFREIHRADELGSGLRKMMFYGERYGKRSPQLVEGDTFRMVISVPEFSQPTAKAAIGQPASDQVIDQVSDQVIRLVKAMKGEMKRAEIQRILGLKHATHFHRHYLQPALAAGLVEMTLPDKPTSSQQRYRLTEKGRAAASMQLSD